MAKAQQIESTSTTTIPELRNLGLAAAAKVPVTVVSPAAISVFIISLGMVEHDGVLISLGILLGLATIAMIGALGLGILSLFGVAAV